MVQTKEPQTPDQQPARPVMQPSPTQAAPPDGRRADAARPPAQDGESRNGTRAAASGDSAPDRAPDAGNNAGDETAQIQHQSQTQSQNGTRAQPDAPAQAGAQPQQVQLVIPERAKLAPNVKLAGEMKESGFVEEPWLVDRDGGYIQLTELLYKVAEQVNGTRTHDEIAAAVSETYGKNVTADNVRQLLEKLIPLGVIANGDGTVLGSAAGSAGRSPLAVNMKMAMVDPKLIDPLTRVLQTLFWPPVLIAVLLAGLTAEAWMLFVHGVGGSMHDALYAPGLLLAALGIIVFAAGFHELGHAAALRYGGGKVRGMGAGLYLIYPAFYTDVSDNYRLGRWAKVRTDLGGFYFNLIFALGVMGVYVLTGWEFLLIVVVLINFDIIR